ncbi:glycoside hydrolase superfamily [Zopfochytrium polystomum]|nr:glycoside hydrolase superfamily [Zopfochytrium polystomum]
MLPPPPLRRRRPAAAAPAAWLAPAVLLLAFVALARAAVCSTTPTTPSSSSSVTAIASSTASAPTTSTLPAQSATRSCAPAARATASALPRLAVNSRFVVETSTNRTVFLHGMNMAAKMPPFELVDLSSDASIAAALDPLQRAGFNFVRLAFTWEAFEPVQGQYSASYLAQYVAVVKALRQRGIYTLVDFHQDTYSRCGTVPSEAQSVPADITSAQALKANMCPLWGVLEVLQELAAPVAGALVGESGVFAFDVINEPFSVTTQLVRGGRGRHRVGGLNIIYAGHHYDDRFTVDAIDTQLTYWVKESGILYAVEAFTSGPSEATAQYLITVLTVLDSTMQVLAQKLAPVLNATGFDLTPILTTVDGAAKTLGADVGAVLANGGTFSGVLDPSNFTKTATDLVAFLDGSLFSDEGLVTLLKVVLPTLPSGTDDAVAALAATASGTFDAPLLVGEFGCEPGSAYMDCAAWVAGLAASADAALAAGWGQWVWEGQWTPTLRDDFNLEDLSVTEGVSGGWATRATFLGGRPLVRAVAGTPTNITSSATGVAVQFTVGSAVAGAATELFFDQAAACGVGKAATLVADASLTCGVDVDAAIISCTSSAASGTSVYLSVSC